MTISTARVPASSAAVPPQARPDGRCPLCDGSDAVTVRGVAAPSGRIAEVYELMKCPGCEVVFLRPQPHARTLAKLYDEDFYFSTGWHYDALAAWVIEWIQSRRRRRVESCVRPGRMLDVGSGDGSFCHHMARHGWDATGVDPSPAAIARARRAASGARFVRGSLDDYAGRPGGLDLITMWQVLEHIGEPRPQLRRCCELLRRGGVLVASVPNIEGWSSRLTGSRWWGLDVPRHLVDYAPDTLARAMENAGLRVLRIRHRSLQYDPYALLHSALDWAFTRRHFLSDLAKRQVPPDMKGGEVLCNVAALAALAPALAPLSLLVTSVAACCGRGGFIEVHARRD
jgi:SAM-dependent methyltransferase